MQQFNLLDEVQQDFLENLEADESEVRDFLIEVILLSLLEVVTPQEKAQIQQAYQNSEAQFLELTQRYCRKYERVIKGQVAKKLQH